MQRKTSTYRSTDGRELTPREREILKLIVHSFIETAGPVGSGYLARSSGLGLSAASIRNSMSDLESQGYLDHPYTSAGRVPTERGYRAFVDELMETPALSPMDKKLLRVELERLMGDPDGLLRESSRILGRLSNLLAVVLSPRLSNGVLERLEVVPLSSSRVMFVLSVRGSLVQTIVLEIDTELRRSEIERVVNILNERLAGLTLEEIRRTYATRVRDIEDEQSGIVRLVLREGSYIFADPAERRQLQLAGAQNMLKQPEFQEPEELQKMIGMLEDNEFVVHLLEGAEPLHENEPGRARVAIGRENENHKAQGYSVVSARYQMGDTVGTIGIIGPTRMDYSRVLALVEGMASLLSGNEQDD